ncbi:NUDIX hydrolase [Ignisphaera sp. 4213-co]|uniref:NUDIX hydrolase n=1 Tax=Ignisphaera cupida TaxID=3050454 RepID=A0ABD4Z5W4_9CREN|nr:NUDIX hydrolase [Ignisphaera sp. 4213-co]MDK6028604.1 NUDIX hydrolase [Ignisphaera sp. 4213-co]
MSKEAPAIIRDEFLCKGKRISLFKRIIKIGDKVVEKDVVKFGKAVVIVPVLNNGKIVFIRQWRASVNSWVLEVPAGRVEDGESPEAAAMRELREETGYVANKLTPLATVFVSPGYSDEIQTIFVAKELKFVGASPEAGEILANVYMTPQEYLDTLNSGGIADLKTLAAVLLYINLYDE